MTRYAILLILLAMGCSAGRDDGNYMGRLSAAGQIKSVNQADQVYYEISLDAAGANRPDIVMQALRGIKSVNIRDQAAVESVIMLCKAGNSKAAEEIAKGISTVQIRDQAMAHIATGKG